MKEKAYHFILSRLQMRSCMKPELHVMLSFVRSLRERAKDYQIECEKTLLCSAVRLKSLVEEYERLRISLICSEDEHINKIGNIISR
ncbi:hypothetical protein D9Q81_01220 [Candidatus Korarchaeum cryptofilum]|uniref:Uncharacterized protein n=1 Tax=Candidatus Korarchaeum cryptofilum TaxID=498846 RepID=A0A3R9QA71_9CREN|nr:hypothetical protein D9Q81_01220 [Candidatus Korarchaeum cryptofilum]